jgi:hypothetical protein
VIKQCVAPAAKGETNADLPTAEAEAAHDCMITGRDG